MTEGRGFHKFALAFVQSLPVLVVAYLFSFVTETEIHSNTIFYLYLLHFVAFYVSDYNQDYFKRGHLVEFLQTLKYSLCFALAISFRASFGGEVLPLPPGDDLFSVSSDSCPLFNELLH